MRRIHAEFDYWAKTSPELTDKEIKQLRDSNKTLNEAGEEIANGEFSAGLTRIADAESDYIHENGPTNDARRNLKALSDYRFWPLDAISASSWASWVGNCTVTVLSTWILVTTASIAFFVKDFSKQSAFEMLAVLALLLSIPSGVCLGLIFAGDSSVIFQFIAIALGTLATYAAFMANVIVFYGIGQISDKTA